MHCLFPGSSLSLSLYEYICVCVCDCDVFDRIVDVDHILHHLHLFANGIYTNFQEMKAGVVHLLINSLRF